MKYCGTCEKNLKEAEMYVGEYMLTYCGYCGGNVTELFKDSSVREQTDMLTEG